jgi:hypothetical protein
MEDQPPVKNGKKPKVSVHVCQRCRFSVNLKDIGLRGGATGFVTCLKCDWTGPIEIQIVDAEAVG